ncbi:hypothetical protein JCM8202_002670 [Rhodotorula sphaerocarpa]
MPARRPPPQPLRLAGSKHHDPSPAFGKIATYSHRLPPTARRRWSSRRFARQSAGIAPSASEKGQAKPESPLRPEQTAGPVPAIAEDAPPPSADPTELLRAVALAEVGIREPFRRQSSSRDAAPAPAIAMTVQPATPQVPDEAGVVAGMQAVKRSRRTASIHSVLGDAGADARSVAGAEGDVVEMVRLEEVPAARTFYRQPDLSGSSNLSLAQFEPHGRSYSASSTDTLVDPAGPRPERLDSLGKVDPAGEGLSKQQSRVREESTCVLIEDARKDGPGAPRSYLCPREDDLPPLPPLPIKSLPMPVGAVPTHSDPTSRRASKRPGWHRRHLVTGVLVLLIVLLVADLVALNLRVWSLRDAYYDE